MMGNEERIIGNANPHTIKKFELIQKYVESWAHKLLNFTTCKGLVFIDCMSNSGEYVDDFGKRVFGTPVRVAKYLQKIAGEPRYCSKQINVYFSDLSKQKTDHLKTLMPKEKANFHYHITTEDGNELAKRIAKEIKTKQGYAYLLVYDPYKATIDWEAIYPFINNWSEVIINHMVSDSVRALKTAKTEKAKRKYEQTYLRGIEELIPIGNNKAAYEERIEEIIKDNLKNKKRDYYIASFPFFNEKNSIIYNLVHCTGNIHGFRLYKKSAWQIFGGKSSNKNTHGTENQLIFDFVGDGFDRTISDESCYFVKDIADYLQKRFEGRTNVPFAEVWETLDSHPLFPSDGFKDEIKKELKDTYKAFIGKDYISFATKKA